jgi:hypothetical protein
MLPVGSNLQASRTVSFAESLPLEKELFMRGAQEIAIDTIVARIADDVYDFV